jgi:hypothetical protein
VSTRGRRFVSAEPATIGPLVRGASLQYLLRVDPRVCAHAGRLMAIASVAAAGRPSTQRPT